MQEESRKRLNAEYSSTLAKFHFNQRWHIAECELLAHLSAPGATYESCQFSHPSVKGYVFYIKLCLNDYDHTDNYDPPAVLNRFVPASLFLHVNKHTKHPLASVTASYRMSTVADDGTATDLFSCSINKYSGVTGWGRKNVPIKICREDGSLVLDCTVTASVHTDQAGISGASAKELASPVPTFACILSNVTVTCHEWHIFDVKSYISTFQPSDKIEGKQFAHPSLENACWSLNFFPNGKNDENKGNISLYLHFGTDDQSLRVKARFQFFAVFENGEQRKITDVMIREFESDDDGKTFGIDKCSSSRFLRKDGSLLVKCELSTLVCCRWKAQSFAVRPSLLAPAKQQKSLHKELSDCMTKMVDSGYGSDFVVKVGSTEFPVHRAILGCRSDVFKAMLDSRLEEAKSNELQILDFSAEAVRLMVRYIYVGSVPDDELGSNVKELVSLADKYDLQDLKEACEQKICDELIPGNVVEAIFLAGTYNLSLVQSACLNLLPLAAKDELVQSKDWTAMKAGYPKVALEFLEKLGTTTNCLAPKRFRFG